MIAVGVNLTFANRIEMLFKCVAMLVSLNDHFIFAAIVLLGAVVGSRRGVATVVAAFTILCYYLLLLFKETAEIWFLISSLNSLFFIKFQHFSAFIRTIFHIFHGFSDDMLCSFLANFALNFLEDSFSLFLYFHAFSIELNK